MCRCPPTCHPRDPNLGRDGGSARMGLIAGMEPSTGYNLGGVGDPGPRIQVRDPRSDDWEPWATHNPMLIAGGFPFAGCPGSMDPGRPACGGAEGPSSKLRLHVCSQGLHAGHALLARCSVHGAPIWGSTGRWPGPSDRQIRFMLACRKQIQSQCDRVASAASPSLAGAMFALGLWRHLETPH